MSTESIDQPRPEGDESRPGPVPANEPPSLEIPAITPVLGDDGEILATHESPFGESPEEATAQPAAPTGDGLVWDDDTGLTPAVVSDASAEEPGSGPEGEALEVADGAAPVAPDGEPWSDGTEQEGGATAEAPVADAPGWDAPTAGIAEGTAESAAEDSAAPVDSGEVPTEPAEPIDSAEPVESAADPANDEPAALPPDGSEEPIESVPVEPAEAVAPLEVTEPADDAEMGGTAETDKPIGDADALVPSTEEDPLDSTAVRRRSLFLGDAAPASADTQVAEPEPVPASVTEPEPTDTADDEDPFTSVLPGAAEEEPPAEDPAEEEPPAEDPAEKSATPQDGTTAATTALATGAAAAGAGAAGAAAVAAAAGAAGAAAASRRPSPEAEEAGAQSPASPSAGRWNRGDEGDTVLAWQQREQSRSEDDVLLDGSTVVGRPKSRAAAHWASVLVTLVAIPAAWFLLHVGAQHSTDAVARFALGRDLRGVLELGGGALALIIALWTARRSSLGAFVVGIITMILGVPALAAPEQVGAYVTPFLERLDAHSRLGADLASFIWADAVSGKLIALGLFLVMVGVVSHSARRAGRREQEVIDRVRRAG